MTGSGGGGAPYDTQIMNGWLVLGVTDPPYLLSLGQV